MDWAARMLGLERTFWNVSEVGGGVIQVIAYYFLTHVIVIPQGGPALAYRPYTLRS